MPEEKTIKETEKIFEEEILIKDPSGVFYLLKGDQLTEVPELKVVEKPVLTPSEAPKPKPLVPAKEGYIYEPEKDIADIEKFKKALPKVKELDIDYEKLAQEVVEQSGVKVADDLMKSRLFFAVLARLREIRKDNDTRDALTKSKEQGGVALSKVQADKILSLINIQLNKILEQVKAQIKKEIKKEEFLVETKAIVSALPTKKLEPSILEKLAPLPPEEKETSVPVVNKEEKVMAKTLPPAASQTPITPVKKVEEETALQKRLASQKKTMKENNHIVFAATKTKNKVVFATFPPQNKINKSTIMFENPPNTPPISKPSAPSAEPKPQEMKPRVADVTFAPKATSPIEELCYTLVDFRRLSFDAKEAAAKIQEKIALLEAESFRDKVEGIKSWQKSEVNKLYLEMVKESLLASKPISDIIKQRTVARKETLSEKEFKAVMELNKTLRF